MKAVLFSRFVSSHIEQTILPRLKARGVDVTKVIDFGRSPDIPAGDYDVILFMFEMCGHGEYDTIRAAAQRAGKRFVMLPRKSAQWPDDLRDDATPVSARGVVLPPKDRIEPMLRTIISLRDAGQTYDHIAPQLVAFWPSSQPAPTSGDELRTLIEAVRTMPSVPAFFRDWHPTRAASATNAPGDDDDTELLQLYEQEVEKLKDQLRLARADVSTVTGHLAIANDNQHDLREELEAAKREVEECRKYLTTKSTELASALDEVKTWRVEYDKLRAELSAVLNEKARQETYAAMKQSNGLAKLIGQVRPLVPALMTAEEALDKLAAYASKQGDGT